MQCIDSGLRQADSTCPLIAIWNLGFPSTGVSSSASMAQVEYSYYRRLYRSCKKPRRSCIERPPCGPIFTSRSSANWRAQRPTACAQQRRPVAVDHRFSSCSTFEATMHTTCGAPSTSRMEKHDMNENHPRKNGAWPTLSQGTFQGAKDGSIKHPHRELHIVPSRRWWLRGGSRYGLKYTLV